MKDGSSVLTVSLWRTVQCQSSWHSLYHIEYSDGGVGSEKIIEVL